MFNICGKYIFTAYIIVNYQKCKLPNELKGTLFKNGLQKCNCCVQNKRLHLSRLKKVAEL